MGRKSVFFGLHLQEDVFSLSFSWIGPWFTNCLYASLYHSIQTHLWRWSLDFAFTVSGLQLLFFSFYVTGMGIISIMTLYLPSIVAFEVPR